MSEMEDVLLFHFPDRGSAYPLTARDCRRGHHAGDGVHETTVARLRRRSTKGTWFVRALVSLCVVLTLVGAAATPARAGEQLVWSKGILILHKPGGNGSILALSCVSLSLCVSVDEVGDVHTSIDPTAGQTAWRVAHVDPGHSLLAVSCPSTSLCVAVDEVGHVVTSTNPTGGSKAWMTTMIDPTSNGEYPLDAVSCPTATLCVAADGFGNVLTSTNPAGGARYWRSAHVAPTGYHEGLSSVSCASRSLCVAGGVWGIDALSLRPSGNILTSTDPTGGADAWHPARVGEDFVSALSCSPPSFCLAVQQSGDVATSTNPAGGAATWITMTVEQGPSSYLRDASCPTASFCLIADQAGAVLTSSDPFAHPPTWLTTRVDRSDDLHRLACPSVTLCLALASRGVLFVGHVGPLPPSLAKIRRQLLNDLIPAGPPASIATIRRRGGTTIPLTALTIGKAKVDWYYQLTAATTTSRSRKLITVATGTRAIQHPGRTLIRLRLTTAGARLLKHTRRLALTARASFTPTHRPTVAAAKPFVLGP